jgi:hypothetical protein
VEGLGNFGKPTGEFGTVQQTNDDDAVVKWDNDGRVRVRQPSLRKVCPQQGWTDPPTLRQSRVLHTALTELPQGLAAWDVIVASFRPF